jgi:hypothetical protein
MSIALAFVSRVREMACTVNFNLRSVTVIASAYAAACSNGGSSAVDSGTKDSGVKDAKKLPDGAPDVGGGTTGDPECTVEAEAGRGGWCITLTGDGGVECNPVTNAPCRADAGEACDFSIGFGEGTGFHCYPPPPANTAAICANCDDWNGPACSGTGTCVSTTSGNQCARFCCDDGDCLAGHCDTSLVSGGVGPLADLGLCVQ